MAKNYFQIHALTNEGTPAVTRKLRRAKVLEFFARIEPCVVGMGACGSTHYWALAKGIGRVDELVELADGPSLPGVKKIC